MKLELKIEAKLWQVEYQDTWNKYTVFVLAKDVETVVARFKETYPEKWIIGIKTVVNSSTDCHMMPILVDDGVIDQVDIAESEPEAKQDRQTDEEFVRQFCECKLMAVDDHPEFGFKLCVKTKSGASQNFASRNKSSLWEMAAKWIQGNESTTESHKEFVTRIYPNCQIRNELGRFWIYDPSSMSNLSQAFGFEYDAWESASKRILENQAKVGEPCDRDKVDAESDKQFVLANYPYAKAMSYLNLERKKGWAILDCRQSLIVISGVFEEESEAWADAANKISQSESKQTDKEFVKSIYPGAEIHVNPLTVWVYDELNHCDLSAALHSSSEAWGNAAERIRRSKTELSSDEEFVKANAKYALMTHSDPKRPFKYELFLTGAKCPFVSSTHEEVFADAAKWIRNQVKK